MAYWVLHEYRSGVKVSVVHHGSPSSLDHVPLYILDAQRDYCRGDVHPVKRRLTFYSLSWLKEGDCWYWSEATGRTVRVDVGQVVVGMPDVLHTYSGHGNAFREDYVAFFGPVADAFAELGMFDGACPIITLRDAERIGEIADIIKAGTVEAQLQAGLVLQRLLVDARYDVAHQASPHYPTVQALLERIAEAPEAHLSIPEMARACGVSVSHFYKIFRQEVGMAPKHYCERQRMHRACDLLTATGRSVQQIAADLGYEDPFYFSARFRTIVGISPRAYRKTWAR